MNNLFRLSRVAIVAAIAATSGAEAQNEDEPFDPDSVYNAGEQRGYFDLIIKPYEVPVQETTYTDFYFNIPEDLPPYYHIVYGEVRTFLHFAVQSSQAS